MNASTLVEVNGRGLILKNGTPCTPIQGHKPMSVGELFHGAASARDLAKTYIEAAENMERLAKEGLTKKEN